MASPLRLHRANPLPAKPSSPCVRLRLPPPDRHDRPNHPHRPNRTVHANRRHRRSLHHRNPLPRSPSPSNRCPRSLQLKSPHRSSLSRNLWSASPRPNRQLQLLRRPVRLLPVRGPSHPAHVRPHLAQDQFRVKAAVPVDQMRQHRSNALPRHLSVLPNQNWWVVPNPISQRRAPRLAPRGSARVSAPGPWPLRPRTSALQCPRGREHRNDRVHRNGQGRHSGRRPLAVEPAPIPGDRANPVPVVVLSWWANRSAGMALAAAVVAAETAMPAGDPRHR